MINASFSSCNARADFTKEVKTPLQHFHNKAIEMMMIHFVFSSVTNPRQSPSSAHPPPALLPFRNHQKLGKLSSSPGSECVYPRQGRPNNSICAGGRRSVQEQFLTLPERTWAFIIIIPQQQKNPIPMRMNPTSVSDSQQYHKKKKNCGSST